MPRRAEIRISREAAAAAAVIALAPVLVVLVLRLPLINQLNYADAWFYSSYAWVPKHDFEIFGWNYFAVRFPSTLTIGLFKRAFGVGDGYVVLRYLLAVACGSSIYVCVRRVASAHVAAAAVLLLYLQPFFSRSLLWDYTFAEVAAGVIGVALWYGCDGRRTVWMLLPGAALSAAIFANANFATIIAPLLGVEAVAALRQGRHAVVHYGRRLAWSAVGGVGMFLIGYLSYMTIRGGFGPYDLLRPTVNYLRENSKKTAPFVLPVHLWLWREPRLWMPVITSVALLVVLRRRIMAVSLSARIAQVCVASAAFLWLYRFTVTSSVLEVWWSYSVVVAATAPAVGVLLHELTRGLRRPRFWTGVFVGAFLLAAIVARDIPGGSDRAYHTISNHRGLVVALLVVGLASAVAMGSQRSSLRLSLAVVFSIVLAIMSFAPSALDGRGTTGVFVTNGGEEWKAYKAGARLMDVVQDYDSPSHRVFLWWPGEFGYVSITWADLPQEGDTLNVVASPEPLGNLTPLAEARLKLPYVAYVMIVAPNAGEVAAARAALARGGFGSGTVRGGELVPGRLSFALVAVK